MLTRADLAKYPFLSEASDYVRELGLSIEELSAPEFRPVLDRAERRLEEALSKGRVSGDITNESAEILSFPVSNLILSLVGEERARRRFALAESKRAYELLRQEDPDKLEYIASTTFMWKVKRLDVKLGKRIYDFAFTLASFLLNGETGEEDGVKLFRAATDFSERMTRYQVEHNGGKRGGRTKYTCPMCTTLKTHGVCYKPDEICETIRNPLSYYKSKSRTLTNKGPKREPN